MKYLKGGDPVSLIAYLNNTNLSDARDYAVNELTKLGSSNTASHPMKSVGRHNEIHSEAIIPVPAGVMAPAVPDRYGQHTMEFPYRNQNGELLFLVRRYDTEDGGKKIITWTFHDSGQWLPKKPNKPWPLFGLDALANHPHALVLLAEGEKAAQAAERLLPGIGVTTLNGSSSVAYADLDPLQGREVVILPDADEPGQNYALDLIERLTGRVTSLRIVDVWAMDWTQGQDVADFDTLPDDFLDQAVPADRWLEQTFPDKAQQFVNAKAQEQFNKQVDELARLELFVYETKRAEVAALLKIRTGILDKAVAARRAVLSPPKEGLQGQRLDLSDPDPWSEPVAGDILADAIRDFFDRYCILPKGASVALTLYCFHTFCFDEADFTPYPNLTSAQKRSGKSTTMNVINEFVSKPIRIENCSSAALYRIVEKERPCLLIDEADTFIKANEDMRGLLNSGFQAGGGVLRVVGDENEPRKFSTFCPKVIAGIGDLPSTIRDRSIRIPMKRRTKHEKMIKFRRAERAACFDLRRQLRRWADDNMDRLRDLQPDFPSCLNDRAEDAWEPLFQIAIALGETWEKRAYEAACLLSCNDDSSDEEDMGLELLKDIRLVTLTTHCAKITSARLCTDLGELEGRPWATYTNRGLLSQYDLARILRPYDIQPTQLRTDDRVTAKRPEQNKVNYKGFWLMRRIV